MQNTGPDSYIKVAVAVIQKGDEVLLARRPANKDFADYWEFPGGKLEAGESVQQALVREIREELALELVPAAMRPLIQIPYEYPHRRVLLDCWLCPEFENQVHGREGQEWAWTPLRDLHTRRFPPANRGLCNALRLPPYYLISPEPWGREDFLPQCESALAAGITLMQLRSKKHDPDHFSRMAESVNRLCETWGAKLLLNGLENHKLALDLNAGLHVNSRELMDLKVAPKLGTGQWLAASCHNEKEIQAANRLVDFAVLSPVFPPLSHDSDLSALGWPGFAQISQRASIPVYALGGMEKSHLSKARDNGAQGIGAISALWPQA